MSTNIQATGIVPILTSDGRRVPRKLAIKTRLEERAITWWDLELQSQMLRLVRQYQEDVQWSLAAAVEAKDGARVESKAEEHKVENSADFDAQIAERRAAATAISTQLIRAGERVSL